MLVRQISVKRNWQNPQIILIPNLICFQQYFKENRMKGKLSFAQRLVKQTSTSRQKKPSIQKTITACKTPQKIGYKQFKQQHNELKNMLKMFQGPRNDEFDDFLVVMPVTPVRNRLNEKKDHNKNNVVRSSPLVCEAVKENVWEPKWAKTVREDFRGISPPLVPRTEPTIPRKTREYSVQLASNNKKGIPNIGNTCYINAIVQCLFHLPHFNDYFAEQKYKPQRNSKNKDVVEMYRQLYLNVMRSSALVEVSTLPLKRSVSKMCSLFIDWQQEDAHEFMKELIGSIHNELNRIKVKPKYKQMFKEVQGQAIEKMAAAYWSYEKERDDSYIYDSFCGQTYNNIRCINCNYESQCFQNFLDLSIPIPANSHSLQELFKDFFQPEKLSDYYLCGKCNKSSKKSIKTVQLWRAPKFLIIHLKRSQFGKKNTDAITIPQSFTLKPYMTVSNDKTARFCQYSLCGIIMHQGVLQGGHYWCNVKQNGKWYQLDDANVKQLNSEQFKSEITKKGTMNAYILFYSSLYS